MPAERLDRVYNLYLLQKGIRADALKSALGRGASSPDFLLQIGLPGVEQTFKNQRDREKHIKAQFSLLYQQIQRQAFLDLVAAFEAEVFRLIRMATSQICNLVNIHYTPDQPFYIYRRHLARTYDDFGNLGGVRRLLPKGAAPSEEARLDPMLRVIKHRDYLAHGSRTEAVPDAPTVEEAYEILSKELELMRGVSLRKGVE